MDRGRAPNGIGHLLILISTWSERQNKAIVRTKPSATPVIGGHICQHMEDNRTRF